MVSVNEEEVNRALSQNFLHLFDCIRCIGALIQEMRFYMVQIKPGFTFIFYIEINTNNRFHRLKGACQKQIRSSIGSAYFTNNFHVLFSIFYKREQGSDFKF